MGMIAQRELITQRRMTQVSFDHFSLLRRMVYQAGKDVVPSIAQEENSREDKSGGT